MTVRIVGISFDAVTSDADTYNRFVSNFRTSVAAMHDGVTPDDVRVLSTGPGSVVVTFSIAASSAAPVDDVLLGTAAQLNGDAAALPELLNGLDASTLCDATPCSLTFEADTNIPAPSSTRSVSSTPAPSSTSAPSSTRTPSRSPSSFPSRTPTRTPRPAYVQRVRKAVEVDNVRGPAVEDDPALQVQLEHALISDLSNATGLPRESFNIDALRFLSSSVVVDYTIDTSFLPSSSPSAAEAADEIDDILRDRRVLLVLVVIVVPAEASLGTPAAADAEPLPDDPPPSSDTNWAHVAVAAAVPTAAAIALAAVVVVLAVKLRRSRRGGPTDPAKRYAASGVPSKKAGARGGAVAPSDEDTSDDGVLESMSHRGSGGGAGGGGGRGSGSGGGAGVGRNATHMDPCATGVQQSQDHDPTPLQNKPGVTDVLSPMARWQNPHAVRTDSLRREIGDAIAASASTQGPPSPVPPSAPPAPGHSRRLNRTVLQPIHPRVTPDVPVTAATTPVPVAVSTPVVADDFVSAV